MLGLGTSLVKGGMAGRQYIRDGLKLYMPYIGADTTKGTQFVGTGSTSFDGDNDYIDCGAPIITGTGDYTFCAWIKIGTDIGSARHIAGNYDGSNAQGIQFGISSAEKFYTYTDGTNDYVTGATTLAINTWYHVAATRSSNDGIVYVNGVSDATASLDNDIAGDSDFKIGANPGEDFTGNMKNIAVWNRALTATEVQNVMYKTYAEVSGRLASGLVSWWDLESDYLDSTDNDNDGTASGDPTQNADLYGGDTPVKPRAIDNAPTVQSDAIGSGSASFDGTDDYIDLGADSSFEITSAITCSAWVNCETIPITTGLVICKDDDSGDKAFNISLQSSAINWRIYDGGTAYTATYSTGIVDNTWHHLCGTYDGSNLKLYVDGVLQATQAHSGDIDAESGEKVFIGQRGDGARFFDGNICQVGVWDAALDQEQIQSIMEKTYEELTASEKTNLVSYWALDEAEGATSGYSSAYSGEIAFDKVDETLGSEVNTTANATSPTNEANATTGWTTVGTSGWVVASSDDKYNGNYSLKGVSEASGDRFDADRFPIDTNTVYKVSYWIKVVNGSASPVRKLQIRAGTSTNYTNFFTSWLYDTEWTNEVFYIYTGGEPWLYISLLEHSAGDDVEFYFDNLSIKPVNGNPGILF